MRFAALLIFLSLFLWSFAQGVIVRDSIHFVLDSIKVDTIKVDTIKAKTVLDTIKDTVDTIIPIKIDTVI